MDSVNSIAVYIEVRSFLVTARFSVCVYLQEEMAVNIIHSTINALVCDGQYTKVEHLSKQDTFSHPK